MNCWLAVSAKWHDFLPSGLLQAQPSCGQVGGIKIQVFLCMTAPHQCSRMMKGSRQGLRGGRCGDGRVAGRWTSGLGELSGPRLVALREEGVSPPPGG